MKSKLLRFIVIIFSLGACLLALQETYTWYYKKSQSEKDLSNISPRKLEEMRDSIFSKIEDMRQIVRNQDKYIIRENDKVYLDIRSETTEFILNLTRERTLRLLKLSRPGLDEAKINEEVDKFIVLHDQAKKEIAQLNVIRNIKKIRSKTIKLGLDLAGGIHIVLGVDTDSLKLKLEEKYRDHWKTYISLLNQENEWKTKTDAEKEAEAKRRADAFVQERVSAEITDAPDRARQVIQNRVDQFGVSEVSIRLGPNNTLIIQLPGANDVAAAEEILTRAGNLTMQLVDEKFMTRIPYSYKGRTQNVDDNYITDPSMIQKLKVLFKKAVENPNETQSVSVINPVTNQTQVITIPTGSNIYEVQTRDQFGIPRTIGAVVLERKILLEGNVISDAYVQYQSGGMSNTPVVDFQLNADGAEQFAKITKANVNRLLAILLDGKMKSAPSIREEIPGGRGQISGNFTPQEASFLAGILKAGALQVPLKIEELRVVGPSLGKEQIETGIRASIIALFAVIVFMMLYYRFAGFVADIAVLLNLVLLVAVLASLGLTLTLPGIAGIVLTMGMAVDANVIINERIKEEIREGRPVVTAIDAGYSRAFKTILDSNVTTIMAALVISQVGTGPIKGFGITLLVGIASSMFTALFVTKTIIQSIANWLRIKKFSVFPIFTKYPGRS